MRRLPFVLPRPPYMLTFLFQSDALVYPFVPLSHFTLISELYIYFLYIQALDLASCLFVDTA
jgi:hypothetical protein